MTSGCLIKWEMGFLYTPLVFTAVERKAFIDISVLPETHLSLVKESKTICPVVLKALSGNPAQARFP